MENTFINSKQIWIFPCANRTVNLESKLLTEFNFTHIASLAGAESYVLNDTTTDDTYVYCVVGGYYIKFPKSLISGETKVYVHLAQISKALVSENNSITETTTVIGSYSSSSNTIIESTDLDSETNSNGNQLFSGLVLSNSDTITVTEGSFKVLQLMLEGNYVNIAPISTKQIQNSAVTAEKIANSTITNSHIKEDAGITYTKLGSITGLTTEEQDSANYGPTETADLKYGESISVPYFTVAKQGVLTTAGQSTITLPKPSIGVSTSVDLETNIINISQFGYTKVAGYNLITFTEDINTRPSPSLIFNKDNATEGALTIITSITSTETDLDSCSAGTYLVYCTGKDGNYFMDVDGGIVAPSITVPNSPDTYYVKNSDLNNYVSKSDISYNSQTGILTLNIVNNE